MDNNPQEKQAHSFYLRAEVLDALKIFAREQRRSVNFVVGDILTQWLQKAATKQEGNPKAGRVA